MKLRKILLRPPLFNFIVVELFFCVCVMSGMPGGNIYKKTWPAHGLTSKIPAPKHIASAVDCNKINWAAWDNFIGLSAKGTITNNDGSVVDVTMTSNFTFGVTPGIYNYPVFSSYPSPIPNSQVPETTWSGGTGGTTTMCFSKTVTNPVLLLASLGAPYTTCQISFSLPYVVLYDGGGMVYNNNTTLTGNEGNAIIMFPGDFTCVTINSTTPEYYTNITWGLRPPPFPISITETGNSCGSSTLSASGGISYLWDDGDTPDKATNTFHQSGTYIVTVTSADGCITSASKTIAVESPPTPLISGNMTACSSVTLTAEGGISYLWDGGTSPNSAVNTFNVSGTYNVLVTGANGCATTKSATVTITPLAAPSVNIMASPSDTICSGAPVNFTAAALNGGPSPTFQWFKNSTAVATGATYTANDLVNNDTITCRLTSNGLCTVPPTATSNAVTMTVNAIPTISIAKNIVANGADAIQLNPVINGDIKSYLWAPATGLSDPAVPNPFVKPDYTTTYRLTVISTSGCEATDTVTVSVVKDEIIIPNTITPNGDGINDTWDIAHLSEYHNATVDIFNRYGQRVFHTMGYGKPWDGTYNGKRLPVGTYYYIIDLKYNNYALRSGWIAVLR